MSVHSNPLVWCAWGFSVALVTITTRNPLYLVLALLAVTIVYLSRATDAADRATWSLVVRIGVLVAVVSVIFNLFTVHSGNHVLFHIDGAIPIAGGSITANALLYGVSSALSITTLVIAAATFATAIDRAALLRAVPYSLSSMGIAAIIGLSFFPQMIFAIRDVRDAQASRGFKMRSVRDIAPFVIPTLFLGLEHAFNLAEAMESRGFGASTAVPRRSKKLALVGVLMLLGAITLVIGGVVLPGITIGSVGLATTSYALFEARDSRASYRPIRWVTSDWFVVAGAALSGSSFVGALITTPKSIDWSPFPRLVGPPFSPWLGLACMLLVTPALVRRTVE